MSESAPSEQRPQNGNDNGRCPETGQFRKGNRYALRHGRRSERHIQRLKAEATEAIAEQREQITGDLGGADALSRIQADLVERYVTASCLLAWMEAELVDKGPLTAKGTRRALHTAYATQLDRCLKLAGMLGLSRVPATVPSLDEYMREKQAERENDHVGGDPDHAGDPRVVNSAVRLPGVGPDAGIPEAELHDGVAP